jgi:hypothetical protein
MASKACQVCRQNMKVKSSKPEPKGAWVVYECQNNACSNYVRSGHSNRFSESVFEPNGR